MEPRKILDATRRARQDLHLATGCTIGPHMCVAFAVILALATPLLAQASQHLGRTLAEWQADLESDRSIDRLLAVRSIGEMALAGEAGAAEALFGAMGHEDGSVRFWAAAAAAHLAEPFPSGETVLREALKDPVPEVQVQAALAQIGSKADQEALATLSRLLSHPNRGVRLHAAHAADSLGKRASPLTEELRTALNDEFDYVQRVARHALWTLGERPCPYRSCE